MIISLYMSSLETNAKSFKGTLVHKLIEIFQLLRYQNSNKLYSIKVSQRICDIFYGYFNFDKYAYDWPM